MTRAHTRRGSRVAATTTLTTRNDGKNTKSDITANKNGCDVQSADASNGTRNRGNCRAIKNLALEQNVPKRTTCIDMRPDKRRLRMLPIPLQ